MTRTLTAVAAAALATFATFAATSGAHAATTTTVEVSDLDLSSAEGQAKLDARIASAARRVCKDAVTGSRIARIDDACVSQARASLEKQVAARRAAPRNGG